MKTVLEKLGHRPGMAARFIDRPGGLAAVLPDLEGAPDAPSLTAAFVHAAADVTPALAVALATYRRGGLLWFCYPKRSGPIRTDITRDRGWEPLDDHDLLPVAQVAVDDTWSALRFRYRDEIKVITRKF